MDKLDPFVVWIFKVVQDVGIKNKKWENFRMTVECNIQGMIIFQPKVSA
jgi:hypothetical protein